MQIYKIKCKLDSDLKKAVYHRVRNELNTYFKNASPFFNTNSHTDLLISALTITEVGSCIYIPYINQFLGVEYGRNSNINQLRTSRISYHSFRIDTRDPEKEINIKEIKKSYYIMLGKGFWYPRYNVEYKRFA